MLAIRHWSECNLWSGAPQKHSSRSREHLSVRIDFSDAPPKASGNSSCSRWAGGMHSCPQPSQKSSGFFKQAKKKKKESNKNHADAQFHEQEDGHILPTPYTEAWAPEPTCVLQGIQAYIQLGKAGFRSQEIKR